MNELIRLGAVPRASATDALITATEERLATRFPPGVADFYRLADGTEQPTPKWRWNFFPLAGLNRLTEIREGCNSLCLYGQSERIAVKSLVMLCDVLIDWPTYAFGADPDSTHYGHFFADQGGEGWRVASSFNEFVDIFVAESDETMLNCR